MLFFHVGPFLKKWKGAAGGRRRPPAFGQRPIEALEGRELLSHGSLHAAHHKGAASPFAGRGKAAEYSQTNLISDGFAPAAKTDPDLLNPWGLSAGPSTPIWVADNHSGKSTLYQSDGTKLGLVVTIPAPNGSPPGTLSAPTGTVFNGNPSEFLLNGPGTSSHFLFATEDGTISGWNSGTSAVIKVDDSAQGAIFKGLAIANNGGGDNLYATDFHNGGVDVFNGAFQPVNLGAGAFRDPRIPKGFAPFGIQSVTVPGTSQTVLVVTYAKQDSDREDDSPGRGRGFVDLFDTNGNLLARVASKGKLNAPWGVALAPGNFGRFSNDLLIGNFGDGRINAFKLPAGRSHRFRAAGQLKNTRGRPLAIDGLWAIRFGNGSLSGPTNTLYFTAGPGDEAHGLYGSLTSVVS